MIYGLYINWLKSIGADEKEIQCIEQMHLRELCKKYGRADDRLGR